MQPRIDYRKFAQDPLKSLLDIEKYVAGCGLEHKLLHLVKMRASQINGCAYCLDMHSLDARADGETEQRLYTLDAWAETPFFTDRERAALAWTEAVTLVSQTHVPDDVYEETRKHFSEKELVDLTLAVGPTAVNFRGLRLPLVGAVVAVAAPSVAPVAAIGLADDLWSGPERGFRAHLCAGATTGTLKLVGIPLWALWRTRSPSGAVLVALCANVLNQLDTRPGRALKAFLLGSLLVRGTPRGAVAAAVLLAPYDHREMTMLGDAGSNALGAVLGLHSVRRLSGPRRIGAIGALAVLTVVADRRSLGELIESTPVLRSLDALGRRP